MRATSLILGLVLANFLASSDGYVKYAPCKEYLYTFRAKTSMHGRSSILLRGKVGFQFLPNKTHPQALLRIHNARMQQGVEEVNLLQAYNFGNWFSIRFGKYGEVLSVTYPTRESYDVIAMKKTVAGYISGKLAGLDEPEHYETEEEGPEGRHRAKYERQTDSFDTVYVKRKRMDTHVAAEHAELSSLKTTYVSHEMRVPHRIVMEENVNAFSKAKSGYKMSRPPMGPRGNFTVDTSARGKKKIPGIEINAKGEMMLIEAVDRPCKLEMPTNVQSDSLAISLADKYKKEFWKSDYSKRIEEVHWNLESNLTCIRRSLNSDVPEKSDCFNNILSILSAIPDEFLPDIVYFYLERNENHPSALRRQNRKIMLDGIMSIRTKLSQELILNYVLNSNRTITLDDHQRVITQFGSFDEPPVQDAVDYIEDLAFAEAKAKKEKDLQRMAVLIYGIMINLYHHKGNQVQKQKVHEMANKLERKVGIHDPYHWRSKRSTTEPGVYYTEMDQASLVESLGNAALQRSYEHILSHVNSSETPYALKRAGLHALRNYHTQAAAEVLLETALYDEEDHIRSDAQFIYLRHPLSANFFDIHRQIVEGYNNGSFPRCPKPIDEDEYAAMPHHHRVMRRSVWKGFQFRLKTPSVEWGKRYGNSDLGASMGLKIENELDIMIKLTSGHVRLNVDDHAYAIAHIGILGKNFEFLNARVCLKGSAEYELNLLQEYGFNEIKEFVRYWDRFQNSVVNNLKQSVEKFRQFMTGAKDFAKNIGKLDEAFEDFPQKVKNLRNVAIEAARKIGEIDKNAIPPFAQPLINVYWRVIKLHNDIKSDVMNFYNGLADIIRIEIPTSWRYVREGVYLVGKSISDLFKSPKEAISGMFKAIFKAKIGIDGLIGAKKNIERHLNMLKDEKPYWWDLTKELSEINEEFRVALKIFKDGYVDWIKQGIDDFENEMRHEACKMLMEIYDELTAPFKDLEKLAAPFFDGIFHFSKVLDEIKEAWNQLKEAYQEARSIIDRLFGPKAYINFPKKLRSSGAGCSDDGAYPTTNGGRYHDSGVDLEAEAGKIVKSPFAGYLCVLPDGRLVIEPDGSTFEDITVYISNIEPDRKVKKCPGKIKIYTGDPLGTVKTTECVNHLHLSMLQHGRTIDPTRYLGPRKMIMPKWTQTCAEYKLVWLGRTLAIGTILGDKKTVDTSPERTTSQPSNVDLPDPRASEVSRRRRRKRGVTDVVKSVTANFEKFKNTMLDFFDLPSDLGFSKFFEEFSIRRIRLGTIVGLLSELEMHNSKDQLINVIHKLIDMTKASKCIRPDQMTDEELRITLLQRGINVEGSRDVMMDAYYKETSQCPMWGLSLPKKSACVFDRDCLGVECCFDYKIGIFYKAMKAYASIDPCTRVLEMGVIFYPRKWIKTIQVQPIPYGREEEVFTGLKIDVFTKVFTLKIKYLFSNDKTSALLNLQATLCQSETDCLPYIDVITDMLLPLPSCSPDDKIIWPDINLKDFFNREHMINELKKIKTNVAESTTDRALEYIEKELNLPSGFLRKDQSVFCSQSSDMTRAQLFRALGLNFSPATTTELRQQFKVMSTKCDSLTLPQLPTSLHCRISENCFNLDCCLDIPLPFLNKTVALSALVHFDPCNFTLTYGFEHAKKTKLLIDYQWGLERSMNIGALKIKYVIDKTKDSKFFILKFGISACPTEDKCYVDAWILKDHEVPVPLCNENFTNCFGTDFSFTTLMKRGVVAATEDAMNIVLRCLDVEKYLLADHGCPTADVCTTEMTPILERTCYPGLPCWKLQCNIKLNLFVMKKDICAWVALNPCSYEFELGLGTWKFKTNLMKFRMGTMNEIRVGSGLRVYYKYEEGSTKTSLKIHFGVAVCHQDECTPTQFVMNGMEISKPFCDTNFTSNIPGGSIPKFLDWLGVNTTMTVARLAVDRALSYLGISQCLTGNTCVLPSGVSLDGWSRTCPAISGLPALSKNLRCAFSSNCRSISCCLDIDIKIWQGSLSFSYEFDPCNMRLRAEFENCKMNETLVAIGHPVSFVFHQNVTFWYLVKEHPEGKGLLLSFRVHVCEEKCGWLDVLEDTLFEINCNASNADRSKRSAVTEDNVKYLLKAVDAESTILHRSRRSIIDKLQEKVEERIPKLLKKFDELITEGKEKVVQKYSEIQDKIQAAYKEEYGDDPQEKSLIIPTHTEDNIRSSAALIKPPSPAWNWEVIPPSGGAELFQIKRGESGDLKFVVGEGLTQAGIALLGDAIANMTIGDLESLLDFKNIDPVMAFELISQLRELYFELVTELVDAVFEGKLNDVLFKTFDYKMSGVMKYPQQHYKYFEYNYYFFIFPVPCTFRLTFGGTGYWGVDFFMQFDVVSMTAKGVLDPYIGLMAYGEGSANCYIFRGSLRLNGYIMETHLPLTAEIGFSKFPLDVGFNVDIVVIPLRFELIAFVEMQVLFFMRRKKRGFRMRRVVRRVSRAISRAFRSVTDVFKKVFKWETLFKMAIWEWSMNPIKIPGVLQNKMKRDDHTPPNFDVTDKQQFSTWDVDGGCRVTQVLNRPVEEPAIVLESDPTDDVSKVAMTYSIGTTKGGVDLVKDMKFQGPLSIIEGKYASKGPLHITISAKNSQGLTARAFCVLEVLDVTPSTGDISSTYYLTSDPTSLKMEARVFEDSPITDTFLGIGYGSGITGDAIKRWHRVNLRRILGPPDSRGYPYRLEISYTDLNLIHGQLHFVNLRIINSLNYSAIISSRPVLMDLTPPTSNMIINPTSHRIVKDNCFDYTLKKWSVFCPPSPAKRLPNHRLIVDSPSCLAFWNGHKEDEPEIRWTLNSHFIAARFAALHDNETGIRGYSICVGTSLGGCDTFPPYDPHEAIVSPDEWNYIGYALKDHNVAFPDGKYYQTLRAINRVANGGPFATTISHYAPFVIDTSPPEIDNVNKLRYDVKSKIFRFYLQTNDVHSGLMKVSFAAGKTRHDISISPMKEIHRFPNTPDAINTFDGEVETKFAIADGEKIFIHLLVYNNVEIEEVFTSTRPFVVDTTPPLPGRVFRGKVVGIDSKFFGQPGELCVAWQGFTDPESGIDSYNIAFGTCEGCFDVYTINNINPREDHFCIPAAAGLTLDHGRRYFGVVTAINGGSEGLRVSVNSSEMVFDSTPPVAGVVVDGSLPDLVQRNFSSDRAFYRVQWQKSTDPESSISGYRLSIFRRDHSPNKQQQLMSAIQLESSETRFSVSGLDLRHKDRLHAELVSVNGARSETKKSTNGMSLDFTPPIISLLHDGEPGNEKKYQSSTNQLTVTYKAHDPESDVTEWKFAVFKYVGGQRHLTGIERTLSKKDITTSRDVMTYKVSPITLSPGYRYGIEMTVINGAELHTVQDSSGVTVDITPPHIESLTIGSLMNKDAETHDGYLWHQSQDTLTLTVLAFDPESRVKSVWVTVGTSPGAADVAPLKAYEFISELFISLRDLHLELSDLDAKPNPKPAYYVTVRAENFAGLKSATKTSLPILVVPDDSAGEVSAGPTTDQENEQVDHGRIVATFRDFSSPLHGIERFEFAVGTEPGLDDVQSFTEYGIVNLDGDMTSGQINLPLELEIGRKHFVTVRAFTNAGKVLESVSAGLTISHSKPKLSVDLRTQQATKNGILYTSSSDAVPVEVSASSNSIWMEQTKSMVPLVGEITSNERFPILPGPGVPVYTNVRVESSLGFQSENTSAVIVPDSTAPEVESFECDNVVQLPGRSLTCNIIGLQENESPIIQTRFSILDTTQVTGVVIDDYERSGILPSHTFFLTAYDMTRLRDKFVARLDVKNAAGLTTTKLSPVISRDLSPPVSGVVTDLGDVVRIRHEPATAPHSVSPITFSMHKYQNQRCQVSSSSITVAWQAFASPQSPIIKYEIAVGSYRGATDLKNWTSVGPDTTKLAIQNVDVLKTNTTFVIVRATTASGAVSMGYSDGISVSPLALGAHSSDMGVFDGVGKDSRFQRDPMVFQSHWDFSEEHCPITRCEWAIQRADGVIIRNFTDMEGMTSGVHFGLNAKDGETFFSYVRITNALNMTYIYRSPGLTIKMQPLLPGLVFDGLLLGHDISMQKAVDTLSANWKDFKIPHSDVSYSGNVDQNWKPKIEYYEIAFGTDPKRYLDDVVPFTNVGLNTSASFDHLKLSPRTTVYHATVRAYSRWFSRAQSTSNGIQVGMNSSIQAKSIANQEYVNSSDSLEIQWEAFDSAIGVKMYYVGIQKTRPQAPADCSALIMASEDDAFLRSYYDTHPRTLVHEAKQFNFTELPLEHNTNYSIEVIGVNAGGECARSRSFFFVDFTPPITGDVIMEGKKTFKDVYFTRETGTLNVKWSGFIDAESSISSFKISLLQSSKMHQALMKNGKPATYTVEGSVNEFLMSDLDMKIDFPYFVKVEAINRAGGRNQSLSNAIVVESLTSSKGVVKTTNDFSQTSPTYFSDDDVNMNISFLHTYASGHLELESIPTSSDAWTAVTDPGLTNVHGYPWVLFHTKDMVSHAGDSISLKMKRLIGQRGIEAGGVSRATSFRAGGSFSFSMRAAAGLYAVSSFVIWEGELKAATDFHTSQHREIETICACCEDSLKENCTCDCSKFLESMVHLQSTTKTPELEQTEWNVISEAKETVKTGTDHSRQETRMENACGVQISPTTATSQNITLWCFNKDTGNNVYDTVTLMFDATAGEHDFKIDYVHTVIDTWSIRLFIDGNEIITIEGVLPVFADEVTALFHLWNKWRALAPTGNMENPYETSMTIRNVKFPNPQTKILQFGHPFRMSASYPVEYDVRIALLDSNTTDVVSFITDWTTISKPCVPCISPTSSLYCDSESKCPRENLEVKMATIYDVGFTKWIGVNGGNITRFQAHLRLRSFGGYEIESMSTPATLDITPPEQVEEAPIMYFDVTSKEPYKAVQYQASNDTIRVMATFTDPESGIAETYWAIGTTPGASDVADFVLINGSGIGERSGLTLKDNTSYYSNFVSMNHAGVATEFVDEDGVIVLLTAPDVSKIEADIPGTTDFEPGVRADHTKATQVSDGISASWNFPEQEHETKSEFCVGSGPAADDDVVDCLKVTHRQSGSANITFENGELKVHNITSVNATEVLDGANSEPTTKGIHLEPGKTLHYHIRACNAADKCNEKPMDKVQVLDEDSSIYTPNGGETFSVPLEQGSRRKRDTISVGQMAIDLKTSPGENGVSLIVGKVDDKENYRADSVIDYNSYIVNVDATKSEVSRMLRNRIQSIIRPSFYITTVGQAEMKYPLELNVDVQKIPAEKGFTPQVIYWNTESRQWTLAYFTCLGSSPSQLQGYMINVKVCRTQSGAANFTTPLDSQQQFFSFETQFAVGLVSDTIPNEAPVIADVKPLYINGTEEPTVAQVQLKAVDPAGDPIIWSIAPPLPKLGSVFVESKTGLLTYKPYIGVIGTDILRVNATNQPPSKDIPSKSTVKDIFAYLTTKANIPYVIMSVDGVPQKILTEDIRNFAAISVTGLTEETKDCQEASEIDIYVLHADLHASVELFMTTSKNASSLFHLGDTTHVDPVFNSSISGIPNSLSIYNWYQARLTYGLISSSTSHLQSLEFIAQDSKGEYSKPLMVEVSFVEAHCEGQSYLLPIIISASVVCGLLLIGLIIYVMARYQRSRKILPTPFNSTTTLKEFEPIPSTPPHRLLESFDRSLGLTLSREPTPVAWEEGTVVRKRSPSQDGFGMTSMDNPNFVLETDLTMDEATC